MSTNATPAQGRPVSPPGRRISPWLPFKIGYLALALVCLIQWGKPSLWSRVDFFSGGYLLMRTLSLLRSMLNRSKVHLSRERQRERWGSTAAPGWVNWALALTIADLAVYLDYGHWHLVTSLKQPGAQSVGLLLYAAVALWLMWTQRHLRTAFADKSPRPMLMQSGPFRHIRHPYYAGAMIQKIAVALIFASAVGWFLVVPWCLLILRQVRLEEAHLRKLFGREYEAYGRQTAALVPGVY
jgi:protein-S-isoprenylcysteine O-methyltransferase Ste14